MDIVYMGTPAFSATILEALATQHRVLRVLTRPDAVRGRGKGLVPSPVKRAALARGIPVTECTSLRDPDTLELLRALAPDAICVAAFGAILPRSVLDLPRFGCLNVHASLLPRWRGAAPIERAILAGDEYAGVSVMRMEEGLDTGDYSVVRTTEIAGKSTPELTAELAELGAQALLTALAQCEEGTGPAWTAQDDFFATYAPKIEKGEFFLAAGDTAARAALKVQAASPAHPSRCLVGPRRITIVRAERVRSRLLRQEIDVAPGRVRLHAKRLYLGMADQPLELVSVKPDGKDIMSGAQFALGLQGAKGGQVIWESLLDIARE